MKKIELYTDGSCLGNPGAGGWAWVLKFGDYCKPGAGEVLHTTNNRMELYAVLRGLREIKDPSIPVEVFTDSKYIVNGFGGWLAAWKDKGWKNSSNKTVKNKDLWEALDEEVKRFRKISFTWVKAHNGHEWNEWADELARTGAEIAKRSALQAALT